MNFSKFVALGDSFTEGVGDADETRPNGVRGWADRVAIEMGRLSQDFTYANLAIRGRKIRQVLDEQIEPAVALGPDLVSIYAGGNDILRPRVALDPLMADYDAAVARLAATGAHVVMFTSFDPGHFPIFRHMRGRFAIYTEHARAIADRHGATLVDTWRMREQVDAHLWADDRLHMSSAGHQLMAIAVLDALGVEHGLVPDRPAPAVELSRSERRQQTVRWLRRDAAPWVKRRLTGASSGDHLNPKWPSLARPVP